MDAKVAIEAAATAAERGEFVDILAYSRATDSVVQNEFLLFFKPEVTLPSERMRGVWDLVYEALGRFDCRIVAAAAAGAQYLKRHRVFEQHYGVINQIATRGLAAVSDTARGKIDELIRQEGDDIEILSAFQFLEQFPDYDAESLAALHDSLPLHRFGGGTNGVLVAKGERRILLLNGFHPYQLEEYYTPGRSIMNLVVRSSSSWKALRRDLTGATNPARAQAGSIRALLLERRDALGLPEVSPMHNGVHLSAGPVEAVVEICRFMSNLDRGAAMEPEDTTLGNAVTKLAGPEFLRLLCSNAVLQFGTAREPVFDLTEEWDAAELLRQLEQHAVAPVTS